MSHENILDQQVNRWGFWSVIVFIITSALSMYLPLDIVNGYAAAHLDRVAWLQENRGLFIVGWVNQIVAMLTLSGAFAATAWVAAGRNTFCGILGAFFVAMATMAFVIPSSLQFGLFQCSPTLQPQVPRVLKWHTRFSPYSMFQFLFRSIRLSTT